jgi:hypothetical protein
MKTVSVVLAASLCLSPVVAHAAQGWGEGPQARAELNRQQAAFAERQLEQNAANLRAYQMAVAARAATIRAQQQAYQARLAGYHQEMQAWHSDIHS